MTRDDQVIANADAELISNFQESRFDDSSFSNIVLDDIVFDFEFDSMSDFISHSE